MAEEAPPITHQYDSKGALIREFLQKMQDYGTVATQNLFKCVFAPNEQLPKQNNPSTMGDIEFFVSEVTLPGLTVQASEQIYWNGQVAEIPYIWDFDRDFTLTVLNDGMGKLYNAFFNFISAQQTVRLDKITVTNENPFIMQNENVGFKTTDSKNELYIYQYNPSNNLWMNLYHLFNVRFKQISGLSFSSSSAAPSTFTLNGTGLMKMQHTSFDRVPANGGAIMDSEMYNETASKKGNDYQQGTTWGSNEEKPPANWKPPSSSMMDQQAFEERFKNVGPPDDTPIDGSITDYSNYYDSGPIHNSNIA